jgi:hypothetical protein
MKVPKDIALAIVKGSLADSAQALARIHNISIDELAQILEEIATSLRAS